ncbi:MAG: adenylate/guanylate cyclase domain-containing protein [Synergistaceae bacterium]|jgi:adenylate cyclase|nr:adenylate/guanylate cyclase domain-containing protein [Synergistaceae bacterium]
MSKRITAFFRGKSFAAVALGALASAALTVLYLSRPATLTRLDFRIYDMLLPLRAAPAPSPIPVIIDIDEASLSDYGQWPWPRYLVADLVRALGDYGVAAVGIDIIFAEPDNSSPSQVASYLNRDRGLDVGFTGLPTPLRDYDALLADAVANSRIVLGAYATSAAGVPPDESQAVKIHLRERIGAIPYEPRLSSAFGAILPLPPLRENAVIGFINVDPDPDGIVRKIPLLIRAGGNIYPSLALRALMTAAGASDIMVTSGPDGLESLRMGRFGANVTPSGEMYIPFIGPSRTYPYYSASDALRGRIPRDALRGRIAFIGTSAAGLLDIRTTPFDKVYPGVEVHAAAIDALIAGNSIIMPSWTADMQLAYIIIAGILSASLFGFAPPVLYVPFAAAAVGAPIALARYFFARGYFVSPLYAVMTVALSGALVLVFRFWQENRQRKRIKATFSRYVSPKVVNRVMLEKGDLLAGAERVVSIVFTDIRGFTSISERLTPQQTVNLLNRYFAPMTALVQESDGTLDKFIGDALMAFWNAPVETPDHARRAIDAALSMGERLQTMNAELESDFGLTLRMGAGIHTGAVYVGNMGSRDLVNYTLIGDNVNIASRLEGLCPKYGVPATTSGDTADEAGDAFAYQYLDTIKVKGRSAPIKIYSPMRHEEGQRRAGELERWTAAVAIYLAGDFNKAQGAFGELARAYPERDLYGIFAGRARKLAGDPPEIWDGVWTMTGK